MTDEQIPKEEDYYAPNVASDRLLCYNCHKFTIGIREIRMGRTRFAYKFWWLCPDCFKKLILQENTKEKVIFT